MFFGKETRAERGEAIQQQAGADIVLHPRRCTGVQGTGTHLQALLRCICSRYVYIFSTSGNYVRGKKNKSCWDWENYRAFERKSMESSLLFPTPQTEKEALSCSLLQLHLDCLDDMSEARVWVWRTVSYWSSASTQSSCHYGNNGVGCLN